MYKINYPPMGVKRGAAAHGRPSVAAEEVPVDTAVFGGNAEINAGIHITAAGIGLQATAGIFAIPVTVRPGGGIPIVIHRLSVGFWVRSIFHRLSSFNLDKIQKHL